MNIARNAFASFLRLLPIAIACITLSTTLACTGDVGDEPTPEGEPDAGPEGDITGAQIGSAYNDLIQNCETFESRLGFWDDTDFTGFFEEILRAAEENPNIVVDQPVINSCYAYLISDQACEDLQANDANFGATECGSFLIGQLGADEVCDASECSPGLYCAGGQGPECGTCLAIPQEGETCDDFRCADGLTCEFNDAFEQVCVPSEPNPSAGDACEDRCGSSFGPLACVDGTCVQKQIAVVGEDCDDVLTVCAPVNDVECVIEGDETDGTCEAIPELGESCAATRRCINGFCDDTDTCAAYRELGETCVPGGCGGDTFCNADDICESFDDEEEEQCTE